MQSAGPLNVDSVVCDYPGLKTAWHQIDQKTLLVELDYLPETAQGDLPASQECRLLSNGKLIGSIPVNIVDLR